MLKKEEFWQDFLKTGKIDSFLRYKNSKINNSFDIKSNEYNSNNISSVTSASNLQYSNYYDENNRYNGKSS